MIIRPLRDTDSLAALTELLHRAYAPLGRAGMNYTAVDQSERTTRERIGSSECWLAEDEGEVVGTILFHPPGRMTGCAAFETPGMAVIGQLAVDPGRQGGGIGNRLLRTAERRTVEVGAHSLALDTSERAHHLIAWYEREGFRFAEYAQWAGKTYRSVIMVKPVPGTDG